MEHGVVIIIMFITIKKCVLCFSVFLAGFSVLTQADFYGMMNSTIIFLYRRNLLCSFRKAQGCRIECYESKTSTIYVLYSVLSICGGTKWSSIDSTSWLAL